MRRASSPGMQRAFDELRFGAERTLDLHVAQPSAADAVSRVDQWLRQKQVEKATEVLVITGRGNNSPDGVSVVRAAVRRALTLLKHKRVVAEVHEHSPGAFAVTLEPAQALFEAGLRRRNPAMRPPALTLREAMGLEPSTFGALRALSERALDALGVPRTERFVRDEIRRQFSLLAASIPPDEPDREHRLRAVIAAALEAYDDVE